jgi:hypothetical protein
VPTRLGIRSDAIRRSWPAARVGTSRFQDGRGSARQPLLQRPWVERSAVGCRGRDEFAGQVSAGEIGFTSRMTTRPFGPEGPRTKVDG